MNPRIQAYIDIVESGEIPMCREQLLLIKRVKAAFENEKIHVDDEQLERYMGLQKYFEYKLLPWEEFVFALHNCTYTESGALRWPILFIEVGRGAGKNGYLAYEDFALVTPINGVKHYNIDIFRHGGRPGPRDLRRHIRIAGREQALFSKILYLDKRRNCQ